MAFTYSDSPKANYRDAIRFLIGDTELNKASLHISDGELEFILGRYGKVGTDVPNLTDRNSQQALLVMAAEACEAWAGKFAKEANYSSGGMNEQANQKSQETRRRAKELRVQARRGVGMSVLGRSQGDKETALLDDDKVQPAFVRGLMDDMDLDQR